MSLSENFRVLVFFVPFAVISVLVASWLIVNQVLQRFETVIVFGFFGVLFFGVCLWNFYVGIQETIVWFKKRGGKRGRK